MAVGTGNTQATPWRNADGLDVKLANYFADSKNRTNKSTSVVTFGATNELVVPFDLTKMASGTTSYTKDANNDGVTDCFSEGDPHIPAFASITSCRIYCTETAVGGTNFAVGTYKVDGTIVAVNNLATTTEVVTANLVKGGRVNGNGALVSSTLGSAVAGVGSNNSYVGIVTSGTFTAGKGFIVVTYVQTLPEDAANN